MKSSNLFGFSTAKFMLSPEEPRMSPKLTIVHLLLSASSNILVPTYLFLPLELAIPLSGLIAPTTNNFFLIFSLNSTPFSVRIGISGPKSALLPAIATSPSMSCIFSSSLPLFASSMNSIAMPYVFFMSSIGRGYPVDKSIFVKYPSNEPLPELPASRL